MVAQTCPGDDQLLAFAEGLLATAEREGVEEHLAGCPDCSAVVGATYRQPQPTELVVVGRYRVQEEIGRGGMGRVLRAHDPSLDRDVAIKLILPSALSAGTKERFAREAVTLGALRHPNVLEVFDVGEVEGTPYFVMEFVQGQNLDVWSRGRSPHEILECLRGAGRGLAAAHAQRVLHRDFKPSNVIVGRDGRAKVADFGLAGFEIAQTAPTGGGAAVDSLTKTGAIMGTLAYMAPELLDGGKASFVSDQFAFCVTMHEVLYGSRPFSGRDARALSAAIRGGEIPAAAQDVVIPRRARQALTRGLSPDPRDRFPSMRALLHELRPGRSNVTKLWLGLSLTTASGLMVAGALRLTSPQSSVCLAFAGELDGAYDSRAREKIQASFAESELPYAKASSRSTIEGLDAYAERWIAGATDSCSASEKGELPGDALDLRMGCFRHAAQSLDALVELLESPEQGHLENGSELVATLPSLRLCSDPEALKRFNLLPADAAEAAQAEALDPVLSQAHAKTLVKDFDGAWELLERHRVALDAATYPPIRVRALRTRARVLLALEDLEGARETSLLAHQLAVQHRLDRDASRTATLLGKLASRTGNAQQAERWFDVALSLAEAGGLHQLKALTFATASQFYEERGELDRAVDAARRSVELIKDDPSCPPTSRAEVLLAYSDRLFARGGNDDGLAQLQEAHRILLPVHGDTHPAIGNVERSLQVRASRRGDYQASFRHGREALRITLAIDGEGSLRAIEATGNLAIALKELGRYEDAGRELRRADAMLEKWPAYRNTIRIPLLINLANVMLGLGRNDEARDALTQARALSETRADQRERSVLIDALLSIVELRDGDLDAARRLASGALKVSIDIFGEDHFHTADVCAHLGHVELEAKNFELARGLLSRALAVESATEADRGKASFLLGRATLEDPEASASDRVRGLELAQAARLALSSKPSYAALLGDVETWIERYAPPE